MSVGSRALICYISSILQIYQTTIYGLDFSWEESVEDAILASPILLIKD